VPPEPVVPALGLLDELIVRLTEPQPLNASDKAAITRITNTYFFIRTVLLKIINSIRL